MHQLAARHLYFFRFSFQSFYNAISVWGLWAMNESWSLMTDYKINVLSLHNSSQRQAAFFKFDSTRQSWWGSFWERCWKACDNQMLSICTEKTVPRWKLTVWCIAVKPGCQAVHLEMCERDPHHQPEPRKIC